MSIVMTGGGTGGHLAIIKAVKEHLKGEELIYIGSTQGQDKQWFEADNDFTHKYFFETRGVVNQGGLGKVKSLYMMFKATLQAIKLLKKHQAKVVFSVGGFSSAATAFAAKILRIPLVIHEQNAALGSLNKLLKPYAAGFISSYLEESPIKAYPIKEIFFENARIRHEVKTIIFLEGIKIIHQAGEKNIDEVKKAYDDLGIKAKVFGFTTKLADYMNEADIAIARAGASTLWELSATALPTLYIPYPYAASDHQFYNAQFLVEKDLAWLMREDEIDIEKVLSLLDEDIEVKSQGLMEIVEKDGSKKIAIFLKNLS
jgi:UDP-N-acetylglucosamine--N-acetylmuramyl-(pentapeptide) pyrophosphoryl-undecaprenol N-acetylglucosamine transferase